LLDDGSAVMWVLLKDVVMPLEAKKGERGWREREREGGWE